MKNKDQQRKQLEEIIIYKAMKDEAFRKNLLENPKTAIEEETGIKIPEAINLKVMEEDPATFFLVLPPQINPETEDELSEAELEMVSGGYFGGGGSLPETMQMTYECYPGPHAPGATNCN